MFKNTFGGGVVTAAAVGLSLVGATAPAMADEQPRTQSTLIAARVGPDAPDLQAQRRGTPNAKLKKAQQIMAKFALPGGPADGLDGPQTRQGLCSFRRVAGLEITRYSLDTATYNTMLEYAAKYSRLSDLPGSSFQGSTTYVHVAQKCQTMFLSEGKRWTKVLKVSTGTDSHKTPNGYFTLGNTLRGWYCSSLYPESCRKQTTGEFVSISDYGNMYNPRQVVGAIYVHGSTSVPTTPASHGCIRVQVRDSDWMYHNVDRMRIFVTGSYYG